MFYLTLWPLGYVKVSNSSLIFKLILQTDILSTCEIGLDYPHRWEVNMHGVIRQQAITWVNVDPDICYYMAKIGHNKLNKLTLFVKNYLVSSNNVRNFYQSYCHADIFLLNNNVCNFNREVSDISSAISLSTHWPLGDFNLILGRLFSS